MLVCKGDNLCMTDPASAAEPNKTIDEVSLVCQNQHINDVSMAYAE